MAEATPRGTHPRHFTGPQSSLDRVLAALHNLGLTTRSSHPNSHMAGCPVHEDSTPSLHVSWQPGSRGGGFVLLHCFGCQARAEDLVGPLGLTMVDLFDEPLPERDRGFGRTGKSPQRRKAAQRRGRLGRLPSLVSRTVEPSSRTPEHEWVEVERYPYVDLHEQLVQEVVRDECTAEGQRHKQFRQVFLTRDGRRVKRKPEGFYPVLYRAPRVAAAVRAGEPVWVVEGEKDVHTAERLGVVATTNTQGGKSFPDELVDCLQGAHVVVVLDRDATGWARGVDLHAKLAQVAASVLLKLPLVEDAKADLSDHVEAGHGLEQLVSVGVEEVATWHALTALRDKAKLLDQAVEQARARLELAEQGQDVEDNRRYAKRWALETQIRQEVLRDLVDQVYGHGLRVGTVWAGQAMAIADELLVVGTEQARRCHHAVGEPVPASLRPGSADGEPPAGAEVKGAAAPATAGEEPAAASASQRRAAGVKASASEVATDYADPSWSGEQGLGASAPVFRVLAGQIVQWEPDRSRRRRQEGEEDEEESGRFKVLLSTVVRVTVREYLEVEDDHDVEQIELLGRSSSGRARVSAPRSLVAVRLQFPDAVTGELMEVRVMADQWRDHSWLESLPGPVDYDHKRAGLDTLQRAVLAVSENVVDEVLYRSTGWRENPDGSHRFIHRRGAITASGHEDVEVAFSGPIERYDLPDPVRDPQTLREAWLTTSAVMLDRLPSRVAAPLLGQVFRAVLGHNPWVLTLVGPPGSYKTSIAAKAMQHFGERWEQKKPASSMSGNGDTFNALRFKLHNAKDALYWMDDFAPTKSWLDAQRHLEETARLIHNQEERSRSARDGLSISDGTGPRASGLCTSEVMPRPGSGAERMLVVPLAREDVDTERLFSLDDTTSRHGRALLMASYISWLADGLKAKRQRYLRLADTYADALTGAGETVRQAAALAHTWIGWVAVTDFLLAVEAITLTEQEQVLRRVDEALREAGHAAINPDMPRTTGARVRELLAYALRQGIAYVDDVRDGDCPPWPMAGRLGWRRTITEVDAMGNPGRTRFERMGIRLGYVLHDPDARERGRVLMCESTQLEAVLKTASGTQAEKLEIDRNTACRALLEERLLIADESEGRTRFTTKCRLHCEDRTARMVTLLLDEVIGADEDDDGSPRDGGPGLDGGGGLGGWRTADPSPAQPWDDQEPSHGGPVLGQDSKDASAAGGGEETGDGEVRGLAAGPPHAADQDALSVEAGTVVSYHHDDSDGSDQPDEEDSMRVPEFTSRAYTDRDGATGWTEPTPYEDVAPCLVCGRRCAVVISGERVHPPCWERSTATGRAGAGRAAVPAAAPEAPAAPEAVAAPSLAQPAVPAGEPAPARPPGASKAPPAQAPGRPAASPTRHAAQELRAAATVVDTDGIWCSNGEHLPLPRQPQHVGHLVRLAHWLQLGTQVTKYRSAGGQIWVGEGLARQMGVDVDAILRAPERDREKVAHEVTKDSAAVTEALAEGFSIGGRDRDSLGRWTRVWQGSEKSVWIVLVPAMPRDDANVALMRGGPGNATLARRIGLLAGALGHPYELSGSTTGLDLMIDLRWRDRERLFAIREPVPPAQMNVEADLSWCRKPTPEELEHEWVHAYDRSGSYLAGASGLELGVGEASHHPDGTAFTPRVPGYWRIEVPEAGDWRMPNPLDPTGAHAGKVRWLTTPGVEFALEQGYAPKILEAYTWAERARVLDPWYERIRDARTRLDVDDVDAQVARDQLKQVYASTIGMLGSHTHMAGRQGYDPDRRHHIVAKARTNILRRVAKIGADTDRWPVAIDKDTVVYTSAAADPVAAWPGEATWMGRELGRYKVEGTARLADQLQYLIGGRYRGKDAIVERVRGAE